MWQRPSQPRYAATYSTEVSAKSPCLWRSLVAGRIGLGHSFEGVEEVETFHRHLVAKDRENHGRRATLVQAALPDVAVGVHGLFQERVEHVAAVGGREGARSGSFVVALEFAGHEPGGEEGAV